MTFADFDDLVDIEDIDETLDEPRAYRVGHEDHGRTFVENSFAMSDQVFKSRYRVTKQSFHQIMNMVIFNPFSSLTFLRLEIAKFQNVVPI